MIYIYNLKIYFGESMGRKSLAVERKSQIIQALAELIRESGYEATTLELVAQKAGVQRTLIRHYFGNRDQLIATALEQITENYRRDYLALTNRLPGNASIPVLLEYLFGGKFNERPGDEAVIDALIAASYKNDSAGESLCRMYRTFEDTVAALLVQVYPQAAGQRIRDIAYAVMCLAEHHATMRSLGQGPGRDSGIRRAAEILIQSISERK